MLRPVLLSLFALASLAFAQVETTTDADGDTIIISVTTDDAGNAETQTISTIPSAAAGAAGGGAADPPAAGAACVGSTCPPQPTTYAGQTVDAAGNTITGIFTFVTSQFVTPVPTQLPAGTIQDASSYFGYLSSGAAQASAASATASHTGAAHKMRPPLKVGAMATAAVVGLVGVGMGFAIAF